ncbi:hypothetical protein ACP0BI_01450 [Metamycoplasma hominis]|uniref:hypothetical protein n=1 Tax=Metamycoplasma hominis TaxID=2098 RepID=UPI00397C6636
MENKTKFINGIIIGLVLLLAIVIILISVSIALSKKNRRFLKDQKGFLDSYNAQLKKITEFIKNCKFIGANDYSYDDRRIHLDDIFVTDKIIFVLKAYMYDSDSSIQGDYFSNEWILTKSNGKKSKIPNQLISLKKSMNNFGLLFSNEMSICSIFVHNLSTELNIEDLPPFQGICNIKDLCASIKSVYNSNVNSMYNQSVSIIFNVLNNKIAK